MKQISLWQLSDYTKQARGRIDRLYLHWSAGDYFSIFSDYNLNITGDGSLYITGDSLLYKGCHTWRRNSRAIGISISCMQDAIIYADGRYDAGDYPPTDKQLDMLAQVVAKLCVEIGLDICVPVVMTHAEVADIDGYGLYSGDVAMRWDLYGMGDDIRQNARQYRKLWVGY